MKLSSKLIAEYSRDPAAFRRDLNIEVNGTVCKFGDVINDWQSTDFSAIDPALKRCNGQAGQTSAYAINRAFITRGRGSSKTSDLAILACWALAFAVRPIRAFAYASDRDQAALLKDAMEKLCRLNPWLSEILEIQKSLVINKFPGNPGQGSRLEISASDVSSSWGLLPDLIIADEIHAWQGDGSLWHSLISSAAKKNNCFLCVITNAGFVDSWQWEVRETARISDNWYFSHLDGPSRITWFSEDRLAEQRKMLPDIAFRRLWLNEWSSGGGDALTREDIEAAFHNDLLPMTGNESGKGDWTFVAGVDLGLSRDATAVVTLGIGKIKTRVAGRVRLCDAKRWKPPKGQKVDLTDVERYILELDRRFDLDSVGFDPWQAELLAQRLELYSRNKKRTQKMRYGAKPWMTEVTPTAANLREMASLTLESFTDRRFLFYPYEPLRKDLHKLRVEEKSYGFRLTSPRDEDGHGDSASAFVNALFVGHSLATKPGKMVGTFSDDHSSPKPNSMIAKIESELAAIDRKEARMQMLDAIPGDESRKQIVSFMNFVRR